MSLSLSTSWNAHKYTSGLSIANEIISKTGFRNIELGFNLTKKIVDDFRSLKEKNKLNISSLHNYCPIPDGLTRKLALPDCYSLASLKKDNKRLALFYTKNTIKTAKQLGAKAVVLHCGRVEIKDRFPKLIKLYKKGAKFRNEFIRLKQLMIAERQSLQEKHFNMLIKSLDELNDFSGKLNIPIGIETRYYFREMPNFNEIGIILNKFKKNIFYWHDTGHAEVHERLGFAKHKDFLDNYSNRLLGIHIHDIKDTNDHLAPGQGTFDFKTLKPYIKKTTLKVIEAHAPATPNEIIKAKNYLEKILC